MIKRIIVILISCWLSMSIFADSTDPKYCAMLKQIHTNMDISQVFLILGPPTSFGQPPNLDMAAINNKTQVMQPQTQAPVSANENKDLLLQAIKNDPILKAFINAPADHDNVLIWQFENNTVSISVIVKGPVVNDVKANFTCN